MEELRNVWKRYRDGKITETKAAGDLMEIIFKNKSEFGLSSFDEDTFSEFLIFMNRRFPAILKKYNPSMSDFATYFHSVINLTACWWKKKSQKEMETNYCCLNLCIEENYSSSEYSPHEKDFYMEEPSPDTKLSLYRLKKTVRRNLEIKALKNNGLTIKRIREIFLVLALKSCLDITWEHIQIVSEISTVPEDELMDMLDYAEKSLFTKLGRIRKLQNKRNFAYYNRKRKTIHSENLRYYFSESIHDNAYDVHDRRWRTALRELSEITPTLVPSNLVIGEILHISPRKVSTILNDAKKYIETLRLM